MPILLSIDSLQTDLSDEPVTGSMHGEEELRLFRIRLELLAQPNEMGIHSARRRVILVPPDFFKKTIAAQRFTSVADKVLQEFEFFGGDIEDLAGPKHSVTA